MVRIIILLIALVILTPIFFGCSSENGIPTVPQIGNATELLTDIPVSALDDQNSNRFFLGEWTLQFDPDNLSIAIESVRTAESHWNVTSLAPYPSFVIRSYDPISGILDIELTLTNPNPISAHDVRLIVYTDNVGIRLVNPDDWTSLFDISGGMPINPFKAFAKSEQSRLFAGSGTSHKERVHLYFPAGFTSLGFAIDASLPGNCNEPYAIMNFAQDELGYDIGSQALMEVDVFDWQDNVNSVSLYCPSVVGQTPVQFEYLNENRWFTVVTNNMGVGPGNFIGAVIASSEDSGILSLYDVVYINISDISISDCGYEWTRAWGGIDSDVGKAVAVDNNGNVFVAGKFRGTVDFDPGTGVNEKTAINDWDIFLSKFDPDGNLIWVLTWGGDLIDDANDVVVDNAGNIYVTGIFSLEVDFDPGPGTDIHNSTVSYPHDAFTSKFDPDGNYIWGRSWGGSKNDFANGLALDLYGNIATVGSFWIDADFDPGPDEVKLTSNGRNDAFITFLNTNGDFLLAYTWGGTGEDSCEAVVVDSVDNFFVTGDFQLSADLDPTSGTDVHVSNGDSDIFLMKFNTATNYIYGLSFGGSSDDVCGGMELDSSDNIYLTGYFQNTVDFDPSTAINQKISNGDYDVFISKFANDGTFQWVSSFGGFEHDMSFDTAIDNSMGLFVSGSFRDSVDFDPSLGEDWRMSRGFDDVYIINLDLDGSYKSSITFGGSSYDSGCGVTTHGSGSVYTTGYFNGIIDFDCGELVDSRVSHGHEDAFLTRHNK